MDIKMTTFDITPEPTKPIITSFELDKLKNIPARKTKLDTFYLYATTENMVLITFDDTGYVESDLFVAEQETCDFDDAECEKCFAWYNGSKEQFEVDVDEFYDSDNMTKNLQTALKHCWNFHECPCESDCCGVGTESNCNEYINFRQEHYPTEEYVMVNIGEFENVDTARKYVKAFLEMKE